MNDLPKRIITAVFFAVILLSGIYYSFYSFLVLLLAIVTMGLWETEKLLFKAGFIVHKNYLWIKVLLSILFIIYACFDNTVDFLDIGYIVFMLSMMDLMLGFLFRKKFSESITEFFIQMYFLVFLMGVLDVFYFSNKGQYIYVYPLSVVLMIWASDSFAYFIGTWWGKHKLMPEISPKKSVEGFLGGFIFSMLTGVLCYYYLLSDSGYWNFGDILFISAIVGGGGTIGDLIESKIKRMAAVKDSGSIIPGHGGVLDRFDAWFIAIPLIDIYLHLRGIFF